MRSATGQQMLDWASVMPSRPVSIDLTETEQRSPVGRDAERAGPAGLDAPGRAGEGTRAGNHTPASPRFRLERLSRELMVDEIMAINAAATVGFLSEFDDGELRLYLGRLRSTQMGRGRASAFERPAGRSAITSHKRRG